MEKFKYEVSCSAPILSPICILDVEFIGNSGALCAAPFSIFYTNVGMGKGSNYMADSLENKYYLPKVVGAVWASFVDRKVYTAETLLPFEEIETLFLKDNKLKTLDLCLLPEGKLLLYVKGGGRKVLLDWTVTALEEDREDILREFHGSFFSKDKQINDIKDYFDAYHSNANDNNEHWISYLKNNGSLSEKLNKYLQRFSYELDFEFEDDNVRKLKVSSTHMNQESYAETYEFKKAIKKPSRPQLIKALWEANEFQYICIMYFNEEEVIRIFEEAFGDDHMQKGELKIKVCKYNNMFNILLNVGVKSFLFKKTEIKVFKKSIENTDEEAFLLYKNYDGDHSNHFIDEIEYFEV